MLDISKYFARSSFPHDIHIINSLLAWLTIVLSGVSRGQSTQEKCDKTFVVTSLRSFLIKCSHGSICRENFIAIVTMIHTLFIKVATPAPQKQ